MKPAKGGPSFFEVLRSTARTELSSSGFSGESAAPAEATEAPKPQPSEAQPVPQARPAPPPVPPPEREPGPDPDPDERVLRVSHTAALFGALIGLIALMSTFYAGIRVGRATAGTDPGTEGAAAEDGSGSKAGVPASYVPLPKPWTIELLKWQARTERERKGGEHRAGVLQEFLRQNGFPEAWHRTADGMVTLYYGSFDSRDDPEATRVLDRLRRIAYPLPGHGPRLLFRKAAFVEMPGR